MHGAAGDMLVARQGARQFQAMRAAHQPAIHHGVRHLGVKLQRVAAAVAERLDREGIALGQQFATIRQAEAFAVPLIHVVRPIGTYVTARRGRTDRVIAAFRMSLRMRIDTST